MSFTAILLQTTAHGPDAKTVGEIALWLFVSIPLLEKIWGWFTGAGKKRETAMQQQLDAMGAAISQLIDAKTADARFAAIENKQTLHGAEVLNQHNTLHEYERERERLKGVFEGGIAQLKKDVLALEPMPGRVANLEAKFDTLNERISSLKEMQHELKDDMKENKRDILEAIAKIHT